MRTDKINANAGLKIANPFKTTRTSTTNPFKYQDFEGNDISFKGNTLQYADVFEGYKPSFKGNGRRQIFAAVAGIPNKMYSHVTESIANFAKRVVARFNSVLVYAKETNNHIKESFNNSILSKDIADIYGGIKDKISSKIKIPELHFGIGDNIKETWMTLINKVGHRNKNLETCSVEELRTRLQVALANNGRMVE